MKQKFLLGCALAVLLSGATMSAFAGNDYTYLMGEPVNGEHVDRTVVIGSDTKYVNVTNGDAIKFVIGDKTFSWAFNGASTISAIDLNKLTPPGMLDHQVRVYISKAPGDGA
ncbi:MAG: CzcE family metal-binding protein [Burkholderiaceae bacterium]|nr:CzcE family metal-binding protein [Burkholderiaceae bacterium]